MSQTIKSSINSSISNHPLSIIFHPDHLLGLNQGNQEKHKQTNKTSKYILDDVQEMLIVEVGNGDNVHAKGVSQRRQYRSIPATISLGHSWPVVP